MDGHTALHIFIKNAGENGNDVLNALQCLVEYENGYSAHAH